MSLAKIKHIPFLIKKLGDGEYRIKIKEGKIQIFSKNKRYENEEIQKIIEEIKEKDEC